MKQKKFVCNEGCTTVFIYFEKGAILFELL